MEEFAEHHMRKHGWVKGKGLGREENGISDPIKVKIKSDFSGIGHDPAEQFTYHWWEHAYKNACANVSVIQNQNEVVLSTKQRSKTVSTKKPLKKAFDNQAMLYGNFVKSGVLNNGVIEKCDNVSSSDDSDCDQTINNGHLTDEQLFRACGGRTAHRGARHGIKQSGKLARLAQHESIAINRNTVINEKVSHKKKKRSKDTKPVDSSNSITKECNQKRLENIDSAGKVIKKKRKLNKFGTSTITDAEANMMKKHKRPRAGSN